MRSGQQNQPTSGQQPPGQTVPSHCLAWRTNSCCGAWVVLSVAMCRRRPKDGLHFNHQKDGQRPQKQMTSFLNSPLLPAWDSWPAPRRSRLRPDNRTSWAPGSSRRDTPCRHTDPTWSWMSSPLLIIYIMNTFHWSRRLWWGWWGCCRWQWTGGRTPAVSARPSYLASAADAALLPQLLKLDNSFLHRR